MRSRFVMLAAVLAALAPQLQAEGYALAARASSTGLGAELTVRLSDSFNLRLGAGGFGYNYSRSVSSIDYDLSLSLKSGTAALDWHPGGSAFRLSGGVLLHGNKLTGRAEPRGLVSIGNHTYEASQGGIITAAAEYDRKLAPYATIGAGNGARGGRVFVSFDVGVALCGTPKVSVSSSRSTAGLPADLQLEVQDVQDELGWLKVYPIVGLGIGLRF